LHQGLDYDVLISTLATIDGEVVVVRLALHENIGPTAGIAIIVGVPRHVVPARYDGNEFAIGDPYPDRYPERLAGGVISSTPEASKPQR
jgi:hypothetical protein